MCRSLRAVVLFAAVTAWASGAAGLDRARVATRAAEAEAKYGATGKGVVVAIIDRGVDFRSADLRNADGTSRILWLYDLTDERGAHAANNPYGIGTLYSKAQIDAALAANQDLAGRDALGRGTPLAGIAAGNGGTNGKYRGIAPEASLIIVKALTEGAAEHDNVPAELPYSNPERLHMAFDFVVAKLQELKAPGVLLLNCDVQEGPTDGTSALARKIDSLTGKGKPGFAIVTGSGDDGSQRNRAGGTLNLNRAVSLKVRKGKGGALNVEIWYNQQDRVTVSMTSPSGATVTFPGITSGSGSSTFSNADVSYVHYAVGKDPYGATSPRRLMSLRIDGALGDYTIDLTASAINTDGRFDATMNPSQMWNPSKVNLFTTLVAPGGIWDGASAQNVIVAGSYVTRAAWTDIYKINRNIGGEGEELDIWRGSSAGPTFDGRTGVDVVAPGDRVIAPYAPSSYLASLGSNLVEDGQLKYGVTGGTGAAAAVTAGVVALMLQMNPALDSSEIESILQRTARTDGWTGTTPNAQWGYGKIDALAAVEASRVPEVPEVPAVPARRRAVGH